MSSLNGQTLQHLDSLSTKEVLDTLLIDRNYKNWSIRAYTNFKEHRFKLKNDKFKTEFVPHNTSGIGIGVASKKVILDLGVNIKSHKTEKTKRFDLQFSFLFQKRHMFNVSLQSYKGYEIRTDYGVPTSFRTDISNLANTISYWFVSNSDKFSILQLKTGLSTPSKSILVFGFGGFLTYLQLKSDYSLIPETSQANYNSFAQITHFSGFGGGINAGAFSVIKLPREFFISINVLPGIGLMHKKVESEGINYKPKDAIIYKLDAQLSLQYNYKKFYTNLSAAQGVYNIGLDHANTAHFSTTKIKLAIGYNIGAHLRLKERP